jgi:hypothetical protein
LNYFIPTYIYKLCKFESNSNSGKFLINTINTFTLSVQPYTQWEDISITSLEVNFLGSEKQWLWEFACYRSEMLKHSSEKLNFIPKKKLNERQTLNKSKVFRLPFLISQQKRLFDQSSFPIQMSLGVFQSKIFHGNESRKILLLRLLEHIFKKCALLI